MAKSTILTALNNTGATLVAGSVVYINSFDDESKLSTIALADNRDESRMPAIGVVREDIENGASGIVKVGGPVIGFDTTNASINDDVFVGTNGQITFENPLDLDDDDVISQQLGTVLSVEEEPNGQINLFPLEIRRKIRHTELRDVFEDQHHVELHAEQHRPGGRDQFIHAQQHQPNGGDPFIHADQHASGGGDEISHSDLPDLDADDHTQYSRVDGTRAFTGTVGGIYPVSSTDLATKQYVDDNIIGEEFRSPVLDKDLLTPPGFPTTGDRYIVAGGGGTATGAWAGHEEEIAQYNGSSWDFTTPDEGWTAWVADEDQMYSYTDSHPTGSWIKGASGESNTASNLGGGEGVFGTKSGVDLQFKSLVAGTNISLSSDANEITINSTGGSGGVPEITFQENKNFWNEAIHHLTTAADGYGGGGGSPGGGDGAVQYNNGGSFGGDAANFFWDDGNNRLGIRTSTPSEPFHLSDSLNSRVKLFVENTNTGSGAFAQIGTSGDSNSFQIYAFSSGYTASSVDGIARTDAAEIQISSASRFLVGTDTSSPIHFYTNNLMAMIIDSSQRIGIGTTSPSVDLDVAGQLQVVSSTYPSAYIERSTSSTNAHIGTMGISARSTSASISDGFGAHIDYSIGDSGGTQIVGRLGFERDGADNSSKFYLETDNAGTLSTKMVVDPDGLVGIGNDNPIAAVDVIIDNTSTYKTGLNISMQTSSVETGALQVDNQFFLYESKVTGGADSFKIIDQDNSSSRNAFVVQGNAGSTEIITARSTGNVGIGTASPVNRLDIEGAVAIGATYSGTSSAPTNGLIVEGDVGIGTSSPDTSYGLTVFGNTGGSDNSTAIKVIGTDGTNIFGRLGTENLTFSRSSSTGIDATIQVISSGTGWSGAGGNLQIRTEDTSGNISTRIYVDRDGFIGIGTSSPTYRLDVNGDIHVAGAIYNDNLSETFQVIRQSLDGYAPDITFQENKTFWNDSVKYLNAAADGYGLDYTDITSEPTGFPNRTDSTISFNDSLLRFSIAPVDTSFDFYIKGVKYTITSTETVDITDTEGLHYIYYDGTTLSVTTTFSEDLLKEYAYISIIYWDADNNKHIYFADERHGLTMDWATHLHLHKSFGAQYSSGLALGNFSVDGDGSSAAHAEFSVSNGEIRDEDIAHTITDDSPQNLSPIAQIPVLYRSGASGVWRKKAADDFPVIYSGTVGYNGDNGRLPFNEFTGSTWQLTEVSNGSYILVYIIATNDTENPIVAIQGQAQFGNKGDARAAATEFSVSGLPFAEFVPIGAVIFQSRNAYTNTPQAIIVSTEIGDDYQDLRSISFTATGSPSSHSNLSNLEYDLSGHSGFQRQTFLASVDPTSIDDGYASGDTDINFAIGSFWFNRISDQLYVCHDNALGSAVWEIVGAGTGTGTGTGDVTSVQGADGYVAFFTGPDQIAGDNDLYWDREYNRLGIGTDTPNAKLAVEGVISLGEQEEPEEELGYGKLYVSIDNGRIFFKRDNGENIDLTAFDIDGGNFLDTFENTRDFDAGAF